MKRIYYRLTMFQKAPLRIGSGDSDETDSDLMLDSRGLPFIPGSSLAGVLRDLLASERVVDGNEDKAKTLFGNVVIASQTADDKKEKKHESIESRILVSDAVLPSDAASEKVVISSRDGVGISEWGTAIKGAKYDFQVAETKLPYKAVIEWFGNEEQEASEVNGILEPLMRRAAAGLSFGARTTRGYGNMRVSIEKREFLFPKDLGDWLDFDPFAKDAVFNTISISPETDQKDCTIEITLKMKGSFAVNVRTSAIDPDSDGTVPDSEPMTNIEGKPVIPGTSISGVIRHHMKDVLRETRLKGLTEGMVDSLFGMSTDEEGHRRSVLKFTEMAVAGGNPLVVSRNAVDRFTAAPRNTGLYTLRLWHGGTGSFRIVFDRDSLSKDVLRLLGVCIIDINEGLLSFGGGSGVGRGRAVVNKVTVDGKDVTEKIQACDLTVLEG